MDKNKIRFSRFILSDFLFSLEDEEKKKRTTKENKMKKKKSQQMK